MADRDWDKELAKIDKQLASIPDEALVSKPAAPPRAAGKAPAGKASAPVRTSVAALPSGAPSVERETRGWAVYLRLLLSVAAGVALLIWPYDTRCGTGLIGYLGATGVVTASGIWSAVWTWRHRAPRAHTDLAAAHLVGDGARQHPGAAAHRIRQTRSAASRHVGLHERQAVTLKAVILSAAKDLLSLVCDGSLRLVRHQERRVYGFCGLFAIMRIAPVHRPHRTQRAEMN